VKPMVEIAGARVFLGDCRDVLKTLPDNSVDSVVTDPPYELGFMGKKWDNSGVAYDVTVWEECLRVLKPGGHVLAFGGSRTWHRLAVAVEDAGFELRDSIAWLYGSGFPKSLDVSKAIDKKAGAEREVVGHRPGKGSQTGVNLGATFGGESGGYNHGPVVDETAPATCEAKQWQGWGTALKPAFEPVVVGRKPLVGTVAENVLAWGVGGLNIDGSRIHIGENDKGGFRSGTYTSKNESQSSWEHRENGDAYTKPQHPEGRWPANVILDEVTAGLLDEQSGVSKDGTATNRNRTGKKPNEVYAGGWGNLPEDVGYGGQGGASRFFYVAKASKRDRNEGLEELEAKTAAEMTGRKEGSAGLVMKHADGSDKANAYAGTTGSARQNFHPTVKPTQLMRYLIKLVTPAGGTVLDPFTGSGSTGKAALLDGFQFVGAELTEEYLPIIEGRLRWASEQVEDEDVTLF
jgi:DNA modification methylase